MDTQPETTKQSETAIGAWNKRWTTEEGRAGFIEPRREVLDIMPELRERRVRTVLDLGCGIGRHSLLLADAGFDVDALDGSETGLNELRKNADERNLTIRPQQGNADELPYSDTMFDFVLSWDVLYHGNLAETAHRIAEVWRVLKPGGLFQASFLSVRHKNYRVGKQVSPNTFVEDNEDRGHPHFYCDATTVITLFQGFELLKMGLHIKRRPGSWHWNVIAERLD
jgi:tellurite methyltransferase